MRSKHALRAGRVAGALSISMMSVGAAAAEAAPAPVALQLDQSELSFGERADVTGHAPVAAAGRRATLEFRSPGAAWAQIAARVVRSDGRFGVGGRIPRTGELRIRIAGAPGGEELFSRDRHVRVLARVVVRRSRLQLTTGRQAVAAGHVQPAAAGLPVALQIRRGGRWTTIDSSRTRRGGRYALADRRPQTMSARVRIRVSGRAAGVGAASRGLGRLDVYRRAAASWYGPGLYGNSLGCGGRLTTGSLGVAHKHLPCGTLVTFRRSGRSIRVPVIDRGPYVGGREYDLTAATARHLGFSGHGPILATR